MEPHTEMAYLSHFPATFFMYCQEPAKCGGGESIIGDSRAVSEWMLRGKRSENMHCVVSDEDLELVGPRSEFVQRLVQEGCRYEFWWPDKGYMDWRSQLRSTNRVDAEKQLHDRGLEFEWFDPSGDLLAWVIQPVVGTHPDRPSDLLWLNQVGP